MGGYALRLSDAERARYRRLAEQAVVDHAASLLRPGGCAYLVDIDRTMFRARPEQAVLTELSERYAALHATRGNDLQVGLRLGDLVTAAGLELAAYVGRAG